MNMNYLTSCEGTLDPLPLQPQHSTLWADWNKRLKVKSCEYIQVENQLVLQFSAM